MPIRLWSLALVIVLLGGCSADPVLDGDDLTLPTPSPLPSIDIRQSDRRPPTSELADVVDDVLPSVVNVRVTTDAGGGQGSGVIIDTGGIILTNAHVIEEATNVRVVFIDGRHDPTEATVVGAIPDRDLAVLRVATTGLDPIDLGRSSSLRLGDTVVAVGFPLGLGPSVTQGIISGEERSIDVDGPGRRPPLRGLLQTDAAINLGNSGGALVNLSGELVGINTATAGAAFAENIGFAIAVDSAIPSIEQILSGVEQGFLGVVLASIDSAEAATELGFDADVRGALISSSDTGQPAVVPGGPADEAGLEEGMVITAVDGRDVSSAEEVTAMITRLQPGNRVTLDVLTDDGPTRISVVLGKRPRDILAPD